MPSGLGIDIGGSHVAAAVVAADGTVIRYESRPTPGEAAVAVDAALRLAARLRKPGIEAAGVGVAGFVDHATGTFRWGPNLAGTDIRVGALFAAELEMPVMVDNEVNFAAYGEWAAGAGRGSSSVLMVTLGTGIGGGLIIDDRIYRGAGFAGEVGHICVQSGGRVCPCGQRGCWESYASGRCLDAAARRLAEAEPKGAVARIAADGPATGAHVTAAAADGDSAARNTLAELAHWIGVGLATLVAILDPDIIVLGGGVAAAGDLLLTDLRHTTRAHLEGHSYRPPTPIVAAALGERAGVVGAALCALAQQGDSSTPHPAPMT